MDNQLNPPTFELQPEVKRMILGHVERGNLSEALGLLSPGQLEMVRNEITSDTRKNSLSK